MKSLEIAEQLFELNTSLSISIYGDVKDFVRAMPDELKYDASIDTMEAYRRYVSTKEWVKDNYVKIPSRKPNWLSST